MAGRASADDSTGRSRLSSMFLKAAPSEDGAPEPPPTLEELQAGAALDNRERMVGLVAAPLAALVGFLVFAASISDDPTGTHHVRVSLYDELLLVLLALSVGMMASALMRKRLFLGIAMALYGLAVFNLHYWGFGIPFLLAGAWYLVRAYRSNKAIKEASGDDSGSELGPPSRVRATGRYTPPRRR